MFIESVDNPNVFQLLGDTVTADEIIEAAKGIIDKRFAKGVRFDSPDRARHFFKFKLGEKDREVFGVAYLDAQHRLIAFEELFAGGHQKVGVHPGVVAKRALLHNAPKVILAHNHPSGDCNPSPDDISMTASLKQSLMLVEVELIDHIIVGKHCYSMCDNGQI
ncbi:JAB domain-containing protein [Pseudomonas veronii]|uniref:JAB domain-containing protein n=1 Tax=Pseudomonas veronii TaxID=76761 RepID=UPI0021BE64DC|nr:JAB domain-containing protein [Pseudomonas veronii]MCT9827475.1 DNA repair protein RadC [Pseudomonas veronii]